ncbi:hypothetical protein AT705_00225 [Pseudoalteromonas rubra]|uniref:Uncharacterized protein n=1 Tax=Pseudoalteromonas rubra TaxID=43658 RepID=A0A0U3I1I9_9GAMM|nr:hypothetical protein AT705_00225 [Pseudoalteromonas rubra]
MLTICEELIQKTACDTAAKKALTLLTALISSPIILHWYPIMQANFDKQQEPRGKITTKVLYFPLSKMQPNFSIS